MLHLTGTWDAGISKSHEPQSSDIIQDLMYSAVFIPSKLAISSSASCSILESFVETTFIYFGLLENTRVYL